MFWVWNIDHWARGFPGTRLLTDIQLNSQPSLNSSIMFDKSTSSNWSTIALIYIGGDANISKLKFKMFVTPHNLVKRKSIYVPRMSLS